MERKPFDQVLHDENDAIAKEAVRSFLEAVWGYPVTEGGQYDVDLLIYEEETICGYVEVERRHNWDKQHFPFDTLISLSASASSSHWINQACSLL
jgi:fibronectin type 3 domain-containing protein